MTDQPARSSAIGPSVTRIVPRPTRLPAGGQERGREEERHGGETDPERIVGADAQPHDPVADERGHGQRRRRQRARQGRSAGCLEPAPGSRRRRPVVDNGARAGPVPPEPSAAMGSPASGSLGIRRPPSGAWSSIRALEAGEPDAVTWLSDWTRIASRIVPSGPPQDASSLVPPGQPSVPSGKVAERDAYDPAIGRSGDPARGPQPDLDAEDTQRGRPEQDDIEQLRPARPPSRRARCRRRPLACRPISRRSLTSRTMKIEHDRQQQALQVLRGDDHRHQVEARDQHDERPDARARTCRSRRTPGASPNALADARLPAERLADHEGGARSA